MREFTALDALAMKKILGNLTNAITGLPTASFWARQLGMTEMEHELIEIQNALVANREQVIGLLRACPAMPEDNKPKKLEAV